MKYIILAQICLTIGTPDWVVSLCYFLFGFNLFQAVIKGIIESVKVYQKKYKK